MPAPISQTLNRKSLDFEDLLDDLMRVFDFETERGRQDVEANVFADVTRNDGVVAIGEEVEEKGTVFAADDVAERGEIGGGVDFRRRQRGVDGAIGGNGGAGCRVQNELNALIKRVKEKDFFSLTLFKSNASESITA